MTFRQVVVRAASAASILVGSSLAACSGSDETPSPGPGVSGSTSTSGTTAGGSATGGTGGSAAGGTVAGGTGGSAAGTGGGNACPGNQLMKDGMCACPAYAPKYCEAITKCVSDQKDPDNCGACANACGMMNACAAGACTPDLATFGELTGCGTLQLLVANGKLYALSTGTGDFNVYALPAGGAPTKAGTVAGGTAFTVDATNAYIAAGKSVMRLPLAGGAAVAVVTEAGDIKDVALDGTKLYYTSNKDIKQVDASASAGTGVSVAQSADEGVAEGLAVAGGFAFYASNAAYNLEMDPIAGDGHVKLGASQSGLIFGHRSVQADATNVYWTNSSLQSAAYAGADHPAKVIAQPIDGKKVIAFAVDGTKQMAYIATEDLNLEKATFESGAKGEEAVWMARNVPAITSVVIDDASVYVASQCKILKAAR